MRMSLIQTLLRTKDMVLNLPILAFNMTIGALAGKIRYRWTEMPPNVAGQLDLLLKVHGFQMFSVLQSPGPLVSPALCGPNLREMRRSDASMEIRTLATSFSCRTAVWDSSTTDLQSASRLA